MATLLWRRPARVVLDTNIWISLLFAGDAHAFFAPLLTDRRVVLLLSVELLAEIREVCLRYQPRLDVTVFNRLIQSLVARKYARLVAVSSQVTICQDPDDDFLLALAKDGKAHFLISGDQHLLALRPRQFGAEIITYAELRTWREQLLAQSSSS